MTTQTEIDFDSPRFDGPALTDSDHARLGDQLRKVLEVISDGQPWGEKGSKQLTLAGAVVKVKAVNWRDADAALTINDLDPAKVEAYLRGNAVDPEKTLAGYMRATTVWGLKDLSPLQQKNLTAMLADPGEWGQGLRQCLKETKYQMMAPEMENA